jgi:hypothetical protein
MAHKQWTRLGRITNSMLLTNVFQLYYVVSKGTFFEEQVK